MKRKPQGKPGSVQTPLSEAVKEIEDSRLLGEESLNRALAKTASESLAPQARAVAQVGVDPRSEDRRVVAGPDPDHRRPKFDEASSEVRQRDIDATFSSLVEDLNSGPQRFSVAAHALAQETRVPQNLSSKDLKSLWRALLYSSGEQSQESWEIADCLGRTLAHIPDPVAKIRALAELLASDIAYALQLVDVRLVAWAVDPQDLKAITRALTSLVLERPEDDRPADVVALLMRGTLGGADTAGSLLGQISKEDNLDESKLTNLRVRIGGEVAMAPILREFSKEKREEFLNAVQVGLKDTETVWNKTIASARWAFRAKLVMSVLVFVVGMAITVTAAWQVIFGASGAELWGPGLSFAAGLGSMIAVVYTGPLREIGQSVVELGGACAALTAFYARVREINYTFASQYAQGRPPVESLHQFGQELHDSAQSTLSLLRKSAAQLDKPKSA